MNKRIAFEEGTPKREEGNAKNFKKDRAKRKVSKRILLTAEES